MIKEKIILKKVTRKWEIKPILSIFDHKIISTKDKMDIFKYLKSKMFLIDSK